MLKHGELLHYEYLSNLVSNLDLVGEDKRNIVSVISEPIWTPKPFECHTLCDLIILYHDKTASAVELKGSIGQRHKAINQIKAGRDYILDILNFEFKYGLFVVYYDGGYKHERILI